MGGKGECDGRESYGLREFISMSTKSINMPHTRWSPSITEKVHQLVYAFLVIIMEVPEHSCITQICLRVAFV